jgi:hypothetical protein
LEEHWLRHDLDAALMPGEADVVFAIETERSFTPFDTTLNPATQICVAFFSGF